MIERDFFDCHLANPCQESKVRACKTNAELVLLKLDVRSQAILVSQSGKRVVRSSSFNRNQVLKNLSRQQADYARVRLPEKLSVLLPVPGRRRQEQLLRGLQFVNQCANLVLLRRPVRRLSPCGCRK